MIGSPSRRRGIRHREALLDDCDGARPAGGAAAHLHRKAAHHEAIGRQGFEIAELLDMAIADFAARPVALPDQAGVTGREIFLPRVEKHHSSGTSSMVIARSPRLIVEAKCHGASRWVVLWVESRIHSIAHPSPSGKSSSRSPGKNLITSAAVCRWAK